MDANINKAVIDKQTKIYVAGHRGLVGSAIVRNLEGKGYTHIVTQTRLELDLMDRAAVNRFFETEKPEVVIDAAAKVGGIYANNTYPAEFIYSNLCIQNNLIHGAYQAGVKKFVFLGSSCIYPKMAPQPLKEEYLLTGPLEPTNEWYAVAKIAGIKMCQAYRKQYGFDAISLMPTNLYGPGDNFDLQNSHVLPALIRKFHEAKQSNAESVVIWGTGTPMREFLYVDDMADASVYLMENYSDLEIVNVGTGQDVTIRELAETIQKVVGFAGKLEFDTTKPDGTMRKLLDVSKLSAEGWQAKVPLEQGITQLYDWYQKNLA
ncbi:MAG: GDP-L-fucose synthase [Methylicorpusculum sp.]|uniref:GDP-L-fucose synthase n=1 Tax=Methylicorpusculum sp. TaxID=2713644 RepID=UPI0027305F99|nr:GDP-L-fucose synthase [Methylicorpusculum sp.]MDP2180328.1 GDP-L-fucose synthase [Methylicorpusculum sp.]